MFGAFSQEAMFSNCCFVILFEADIFLVLLLSGRVSSAGHSNVHLKTMTGYLIDTSIKERIALVFSELYKLGKFGNGVVHFVDWKSGFLINGKVTTEVR